MSGFQLRRWIPGCVPARALCRSCGSLCRDPINGTESVPGDGRDAGLSDARVDGREQRAAVPCVVHSGLVPAHTGLLALFESTLAVAFY